MENIKFFRRLSGRPVQEVRRILRTAEAKRARKSTEAKSILADAEKLIENTDATTKH